MQIETTRFGVLDVDESKLLHLIWGLPGFEELKRYIMMQHREGPLQWFQAVDGPEVAFLMCAPEMLGVKYQVPPEKKSPLNLERDEDLMVMSMVSYEREEKITRIHVLSPLLFNTVTRQGYQWMMEREEIEKCVAIPEGLCWTDASEAMS
jgi:flagellar assembly factor FliW